MSTDDVRRLLRDGAALPSRGVDVGAIISQGRRLKRVRIASMSLFGSAVLIAIALVAANLDSFVRSDQRSKKPNRVAALAEGWTELSLPPEVRDGNSVVWAGSQLLVWGGCNPEVKDDCEATADGFSFDPVTQDWGRIQTAPTPAVHADEVWTGTETIFLFESQDGRLSGQAYDPATDSWHVIASAPITWRLGSVAVWTGSEIVVWGGGDVRDDIVDGAAYDPIGDVWREIADAPISLNLASGVWTGREVIVFGSALDDRNIARTETSVGAAYDPTADTWRELPPSQLSPQATSAVWVGDRMVAWDYEVNSQEYDPESNVWSEPVKMPLDFSECYPDSVVTRDLVFAFFCGQAALYDASSGGWQEIHGGMLDEEIESNGGGIKLWRIAQFASSGDTVFLLAEGITVGESGETCFGCPGFPVSFWAYRPPE